MQPAYDYAHGYVKPILAYQQRRRIWRRCMHSLHCTRGRLGTRAEDTDASSETKHEAGTFGNTLRLGLGKFDLEESDARIRFN